jgi:hypothetical protein
MTIVAYTSPSGRTGTYETIGAATEDDARAQMQRITDLATLLCSSITVDGDTDQHQDNLHQAAVSLRAELAEVDKSHPFGIWALSDALQAGLAAHIEDAA